MSSPAHQADAAALEALIRHIPGVSAIYRPSATLGQTLSAMTRPLARETLEEPLVGVTNTNGRLHITATIGTTTEPAVNTCRAVHDAIADWLREHDLDKESTVEVTVAQVTH